MFSLTCGRRALIVAGFVALKFCVPTTASEIISRPYHYTNLGPLRATQLNNAGQVIGSAPVNRYSDYWGTFAAVYHSYGPDAGSIRAPLGPESAFTMGVSINDHGHTLIRNTSVSIWDNWLVLWDGSTAQPVISDSGKVGFSGYKLNNPGMVVGSGGDVDGWFPATWLGGRVELLSKPFEQGKTSVTAINDRGQVLGAASYDQYSSDHIKVIEQGFIWEDGQVHDLGTLGGEITYASDLNNAGQVVGSSQRADGSMHAFLYQDGEMVDLGLSEWTGSGAYRINESGDILGYLMDSIDQSTPILLSKGSVFRIEDLMPSDAERPDYLELLDINDSGQILARGITDSIVQDSFILTPPGMEAPAPVSSVDQVVPEPTTLAMIGLIGAATLARGVYRKVIGQLRRRGA